ncbi:DUF3465 domain-containing protein [Acinetobacter pollinis]|uniref:DUF3465 domain-containing protein n=1 Tax=Acinetobacter pollinis TaxID=2605270 RepID=A0ABU6DQX8_9GAMM|nr:DUF3465 domain-containing protein [Acinetobacter pollinis]MEB5476265.1 DUF3465 domain-containing protein [Acinetobacter pollinis]
MNNKNIIIFIVGILVTIFAYKAFQNKHRAEPYSNITYQSPQKQAIQSNHAIQSAYQNRQSNIVVQGEGVVRKILPTDQQGIRHQKFILGIGNITVLVAHNIDLAPEVQNLSVGSIVQFKGEYEYNDKGGVLHWTHKDPRHKHEDGWLKFAGKLYQ